MAGQDSLKQAAARAALEYVPDDAIVGVGTGSTVNFFIEELKGIRGRIEGAVSSSRVSTERLKGCGIRVFELNDVAELPIYVDGADEVTPALAMVKGGGGALTGEKIVAAVAERFVCVADQSKLVDQLGRFPLPIEVLPMARSYVARQLVKLGGMPRLREGFTTDHGNVILDVSGLQIADPVELEGRLDGIAGVVTNGLFARRGADIALLAGPDGVRRLSRQSTSA